jgi:hypothetical protein
MEDGQEVTCMDSTTQTSVIVYNKLSGCVEMHTLYFPVGREPQGIVIQVTCKYCNMTCPSVTLDFFLCETSVQTTEEY